MDSANIIINNISDLGTRLPSTDKPPLVKIGFQVYKKRGFLKFARRICAKKEKNDPRKLIPKHRRKRECGKKF